MKKKETNKLKHMTTNNTSAFFLTTTRDGQLPENTMQFWSEFKEGAIIEYSKHISTILESGNDYSKKDDGYHINEDAVRFGRETFYPNGFLIDSYREDVYTYTITEVITDDDGALIEENKITL